MHKAKILGVALVSALFASGGATAQSYTQSYEGNESVAARPDQIQRDLLVGRHDGLVDPVIVRVSRRINICDIDRSDPAARRELKYRIRGTARDLCDELNGLEATAAPDASMDRQCVRDATADAMQRVLG